MLHAIQEHYRKNTNLLIEVETINQHTLENMRYDLNQQNIYSKLYHNGEATVNENCEIFINILLEAKNKHIPKIMRKYNKRKDKKEKWMTSELLNQINLKNDMYVEWKSQSTSIDIYNSRKINFKTFERIVNKNNILIKENDTPITLTGSGEALTSAFTIGLDDDPSTVCTSDKNNFYHDTFNSYKNNIKKTWTTINDTLGRGRNQRK